MNGLVEAKMFSRGAVRVKVRVTQWVGVRVDDKEWGSSGSF